MLILGSRVFSAPSRAKAVGAKTLGESLVSVHCEGAATMSNTRLSQPALAVDAIIADQSEMPSRRDR